MPSKSGSGDSAACTTSERKAAPPRRRRHPLSGASQAGDNASNLRANSVLPGEEQLAKVFLPRAIFCAGSGDRSFCGRRVRGALFSLIQACQGSLEHDSTSSNGPTKALSIVFAADRRSSPPFRRTKRRAARPRPLPRKTWHFLNCVLEQSEMVTAKLSRIGFPSLLARRSLVLVAQSSSGASAVVL